MRLAFVGRVAELDLFAAAVGALGTGSGGFIHIEGEAGIGKSSLLAAFEALAHDRSLPVVHAAADPNDDGWFIATVERRAQEGPLTLRALDELSRRRGRRLAPARLGPAHLARHERQLHDARRGRRHRRQRHHHRWHRRQLPHRVPVRRDAADGIEPQLVGRAVRQAEPGDRRPVDDGRDQRLQLRRLGRRHRRQHRGYLRDHNHDDLYPARIFAVVASNGTLVRGAHAVSVNHPSTGLYRVLFDRDVSACAYSALVDGIYSNIYILPPSGTPDPNSVYLAIADLTPAAANRPFHLVVTC